jgi:hypothetical protein
LQSVITIWILGLRRKEYPTQDLADFERVSLTIYEIRGEAVYWQYRGMRLVG